jgi:hypothetical protein
MRIVRFRAGGETRYGALERSGVVEYSGTPWSAFTRGRRRHAPGDPSTPAGVGPLIAGDRVEIRIDGVGVLTNPVVKL